MTASFALLLAAVVAAPAAQGVHLRDRTPPNLGAHTRGLRSPTPAPPPGALPPGVLDPSRYDIPVRYNAEVARWLRHYTGRGRAGFARKLARKGRHEEVVRQALRRNGLPVDLEWLVAIESGFSPTAVSRAGAVGLWQFLAPTAVDYGLRVDREMDERRDPGASSEAACRMLADLHTRFGAWDLAMASYNAGIGHVTEALRRYNTNDFWTVARYDYLPSGARSYVGMVLAAMLVGKNPAAFGFEAVVPDPRADLAEVTVQGSVHLRTLARAAGVDTAVLKRHNPALIRSRTPSEGGPWRVFLPAASLDRFTAEYDRLRKARASHKRVIVRYGETLSDIARDYGVSVRSLRTLNGLPRRADPTGERLVVPVPRGRAPKAAPAPEAAKRAIVVLPDVTFDYGDRRRRVLFRIPRRGMVGPVAEHFGVSASEIAMWNGLDPLAKLQPGMVLRLHVSAERDLADTRLIDPDHVRIMVADSDTHAAALEAAARARSAAAGVRRKKQTGFRRHTVRRGETLAKIARRYRTTAKSLARLNGVDPRRLRPGQVLRVRRGAR